jgi:hypothetical protein
MSHRSVASLLLATVLCGAGAAAHADSWRNHGNHDGHDGHSDHGNRGHDSYYSRSYGNHDYWSGSQWRPHSDYGRDWSAGREWHGSDWNHHWDDRHYYNYGPYYNYRPYYNYGPYYHDNYYDQGYFGGGWLNLVLTFPLY